MDFFDDEHGQQARVLIVESGQARPCASIVKSKTRFAMLLASDGRSALDVLRHHDIDVIVVDEDMPDMAAPYLLAAVQELSPTTAIIVLTVNGIGVGEDDEMTLLVRQLQPGPEGLPLEIYAFTNVTEWNAYEAIQADIFDHLLAIIDEFGLRIYQQPSGEDVTALARQDGG